MTFNLTLKNGLVYNDGVQLTFKQTPNVSGPMNPTIIVAHDTASPLNESGPIGWLTNSAAKASAHFVIPREGAPTQLAKTNVKTWHAGKSSYLGRRDVNNFSIGIEIVNPGVMTKRIGNKVFFGQSNTGYDIEEYGIKEIDPEWAGKAYWMPYTQNQIDWFIALGQLFKASYGIQDITTHWFISPGRKVDTNPHFPLERVKNAVLFGARGPVKPPTEAPLPASIIAPTLAEKDEYENFDAFTTSDVNIRQWPDGATRYGVIPKNAHVDFIRVSKSKKDGSQWFLISVKASDVKPAAGSIPFEADSEGLLQGFVHGDYIKMVG